MEALTSEPSDIRGLFKPKMPIEQDNIPNDEYFNALRNEIRRSYKRLKIQYRDDPIKSNLYTSPELKNFKILVHELKVQLELINNPNIYNPNKYSKRGPYISSNPLSLVTGNNIGYSDTRRTSVSEVGLIPTRRPFPGNDTLEQQQIDAKLHDIEIASGISMRIKATIDWWILNNNLSWRQHMRNDNWTHTVNGYYNDIIQGVQGSLRGLEEYLIQGGISQEEIDFFKSFLNNAKGFVLGLPGRTIRGAYALISFPIRYYNERQRKKEEERRRAEQSRQSERTPLINRSSFNSYRRGSKTKKKKRTKKRAKQKGKKTSKKKTPKRKTPKRKTSKKKHLRENK